MARFSEDSSDAIPLHTLGKEWAHVFVDAEGRVNIQPIKRRTNGTTWWGDSMQFTPEKAELLIKALKRAIKEAKRK